MEQMQLLNGKEGGIWSGFRGVEVLGLHLQYIDLYIWICVCVWFRGDKLFSHVPISLCVLLLQVKKKISQHCLHENIPNLPHLSLK